jgi:hypothetical protein
MADIRPKDLLPTATHPAADHYLLLDGVVGGTQKMLEGTTSINVRRFGAVGNGATDDTAAFVAAMDHARSVITADAFGYGDARKRFAAGVTIHVPAGRYRIAMSGLSLPWGSRLVGDGPYTTVIVFDLDDATDGLALEVQADQHSSSFTGGFWGAIENIALQGHPTSSPPSPWGFAVRRVIYAPNFLGTIRNVHARQAEQEVIRFDDTQCGVIDNCVIEISATRSTLHVADGTALNLSASYIRKACERSRSDGIPYGCVHLTSVTGTTMTGCVIESGDNGANGALINGGRATLTGCYFEANSGADIRLLASARATITGGTFVVSSNSSYQGPMLYAAQGARLIAMLPEMPTANWPKVIIENVTSNAAKILMLPGETFGDKIVALGLTSVDTGTLQSVDSTTQMTLAADAGSSYAGRLIEITSGPFEGLYRIINSYNGTTKQATVNAMPTGFTDPASYRVVGIIANPKDMRNITLMHDLSTFTVSETTGRVNTKTLFVNGAQVPTP